MSEIIYDVIVDNQFVLRTTESMLAFFLKAYVDALFFGGERNIIIKAVKEEKQNG